jgi:ribose/xylose/arabinose/galactoside ABC-type transport system permease subunit
MKTRFKFTFTWALAVIFVVLFAGIGMINPVFFMPSYVLEVMLRNIVELGLMGLTSTLIIITGGIDLSMGSELVLSAMVSGLAAKAVETAGGGAMASVVGVVVCLAVGAACGFFNGVLIAKIKISPLVATLATMYLYKGLARSFSHGDSVYAFPASTWLGNTEIGFFYLQILYFAIFAVIFWFILSRMTLGRKLYAIGLNEDAARFSGVNTDKVKLVIYTMSGLMAAFAALIWLGRFTSIKYDAGDSLALKVVTIVVLGGTSIMGGVGTMQGTILGALIIAALNSGLTVLNMPIAAQNIVQGVVLAISLVVYFVLNQRALRNRVIRIEEEVRSEK